MGQAFIGFGLGYGRIKTKKANYIFILKPTAYFEEHTLVKVWVLDLFALFGGVQDDKSDGHLQAAERIGGRKVSNMGKDGTGLIKSKLTWPIPRHRKEGNLQERHE